MSTPIQGGCLCGDVRYHVTGEPRERSVCHCQTCRRAAGAPAVAWIVVGRDELVFDRGAPATFRSSPPVERTFCRRCGTPLTYRSDDEPHTIDIQTATLDSPDAFPPRRELWLEHKLPWTPINAALPHHPRGTPT
jgi:hypothetical protein